mmetsp:Transcript_28565/g.96184  ORF Transcript_28565/g.96184 Transcript_28565/m.96184 type:complete len:247 (-) Transcript_28565:73-813(-)
MCKQSRLVNELRGGSWEGPRTASVPQAYSGPLAARKPLGPRPFWTPARRQGFPGKEGPRFGPQPCRGPYIKVDPRPVRGSSSGPVLLSRSEGPFTTAPLNGPRRLATDRAEAPEWAPAKKAPCEDLARHPSAFARARTREAHIARGPNSDGTRGHILWAVAERGPGLGDLSPGLFEEASRGAGLLQGTVRGRPLSIRPRKRPQIRQIACPTFQRIFNGFSTDCADLVAPKSHMKPLRRGPLAKRSK